MRKRDQLRVSFNVQVSVTVSKIQWVFVPSLKNSRGHVFYRTF